MQRDHYEEIVDIEYEIARTEYEIEQEEERKKKYPKLVYKYKSISNSVDLCRVLNILRTNRIFMPSAQVLNDPLEGLQSKMLGDYAYERKSERNKYRVLALSEDGLLATLWSHYADEYKGICLCYRTVKAFSELYQVEYINKQKTWSGDPELSVIEDLKLKSADWAYEKEWRLIIRDEKNKKCFHDYNKEELACVLLGHKMEPDVRDEIMKNIPSHVKVFTVLPDEEKFCLCAMDVDGHKAYNSQDILTLI